MPHALPLVFIALGALALVGTLFFFWQSLRGALTPETSGMLVADDVSAERGALLAEKHTLLLALRDLDSEREAGKLSQEDFTELSGRYRARARDVLRALDEQLAPHRQTAKELIAGARGDASASTELATATTAVAAPVAAAGDQPKRVACACGTDNEPDAVFCKKCGARLLPEVSA